MSIERRRRPRKTLADLAFINLEPDNGGIVVDVSEDGLGFHSAVPVEISGPVKFWFSIRSIDRIDASGIVAWTDESKKSGGIKFVEINDDVRARIRTWLANAAEHPSPAAAAGRTSSGSVTPGSPADDAREAASRAASSDSAIFGSVRRKPPVTPSTVTPAPVASQTVSAPPAAPPAEPPRTSQPVQPPAQTKPTINPGFAGSRSATLIATPGSETTRPSILTSPLSLLATEPASNSPYSQDFGAGKYRDGDASAPERHDRAALPMIVVILAAIAVTVAGYYTLRWRNLPRPAAVQQTARPAEASAQPPSQPPTTLPTDPANSASNPPQSSSPTATATDPGAAQPSTTTQSPPSTQPSVSEPVPTDTAMVESPKTPNPKPSTGSSESASATTSAPPEVNSPELEEARALLRSATGRRESARAAQLLWTAVGNGSVAAEVELARLYITGDGVKKSCEQARVLLRAAMGRGSQEATQQLAALARSGCTK